MPKINLKLEMNKGREGVPMFKLAQVSDQALKFLRMLAEDVGVNTLKEDWVAKRFGNNCVDFDCEYPLEVESSKVASFKEGVRFVSDYRNRFSEPPFPIRSATIKNYAYIGKHIDATEVISFGIYNGSPDVPREWLDLDKSLCSFIETSISDFTSYYGSIQGVIHAFHKETDHPHVTIRDKAFKYLIPCYFDDSQYEQVVEMFEKRDATVYVEGTIKENVIEEKIDSVSAKSFRQLKKITVADVDAFVGCARAA
jgi:hypothetical protein